MECLFWKSVYFVNMLLLAHCVWREREREQWTNWKVRKREKTEGETEQDLKDNFELLHVNLISEKAIINFYVDQVFWILSYWKGWIDNLNFENILLLNNNLQPTQFWTNLFSFVSVDTFIDAEPIGKLSNLKKKLKRLS